MFNFDNDKPIYLQIRDDILTKIFRDEIKLGDKLPSVRDLAILYTVNPNTIQKVISDLGRDNIIFVERGKGTFLTDNIELINKLRMNVINEEVKMFINKLINMGMKREDIMQEVKGILNGVDIND